MMDERDIGLKLIKDHIEKRAHQAIVIDFSIGTGAISPSFAADITCDDLSLAGGMTREQVRAGFTKQRDAVTAAMAKGLEAKLGELYRKGSLQGVIALAGMTGTLIALPALKELPFGLPKVLVSSATALPRYADYYAKYFSLNDITVMHSVIDTVGMNAMLRTLLLNGAGAICGMVESYEAPAKGSKPPVAI